ncbi:hypothetical protein PG997_000349 [Apiospora hydei]|uniref:Transmembrane protein n=1 Tax=Apiospora hydei TaxID=1337664 RepID=A0ABR1XAN9_9PEZI
MSTVTFSVLEKPKDGSEVRRQQAQSDPTLPCMAGIVEAAAPTHPTLDPGSASTQTNGNRLGYRSSFRVLFSHHLSVIPDKLAQCWKSVWKDGKLQNYREAFVASIAFVALLMAGVTIWPTITAASDGRKSELLTEWNTRKDFLSHCEEHADEPVQVNGPSSSMLATLLWYPGSGDATYRTRPTARKNRHLTVPSGQSRATTSAADVQENRGLETGLRRRHAAHSIRGVDSGGIDSVHLSNLTEWNIPSILGEAKETGLVELCDNKDGASVPCHELCAGASDSLQSPIARINKHIYHPIPARVSESGNSSDQLFNQQAQTDIRGLEAHWRRHTAKHKYQPALPIDGQKCLASESEGAATLVLWPATGKKIPEFT